MRVKAALEERHLSKRLEAKIKRTRKIEGSKNIKAEGKLVDRWITFFFYLGKDKLALKPVFRVCLQEWLRGIS